MTIVEASAPSCETTRFDGDVPHRTLSTVAGVRVIA